MKKGEEGRWQGKTASPTNGREGFTLHLSPFTLLSRDCLIAILLVTFCLAGCSIHSRGGETIADLEMTLWSTAQKKNSEDIYNSYLAQFPAGRFTVLAKAAIIKIKSDQLIKEENSEWQVVKDSEDSIAVQKFIDKHPQGSNMLAAKIRLSAIRKIESEYKPGQTFKGCTSCPEMVIVPPGRFMMGEAKSLHLVTFSLPFAIGKKEVTQKEWIAIMGSNPSKFKDCIGNCPVDNVSWNDAKEFVRKLNIKTGKEYRLPSEAEWEYACRAGMQQDYCGSNDVDSVAWYGAYSNAKEFDNRSSRPVATKQANAWGLFDMSGNVAEWTEDGFHESAAGAPADGVAWAGDGRGYVLRGGSWEESADQVLASHRDYDGPSNRDVTYGFRVARSFP